MSPTRFVLVKGWYLIFLIRNAHQNSGLEILIILRSGSQTKIKFLLIKLCSFQFQPLLLAFQNMSISLFKSPGVHLLVIGIEPLAQVVVAACIPVVLLFFFAVWPRIRVWIRIAQGKAPREHEVPGLGVEFLPQFVWFLHILSDEVPLEFQTLFAHFSVGDREHYIFRLNGADHLFQLSVVRMTRIWNLKIERQVTIVLIVPTGQNDKNRRFLLIARLDTIKWIS